MTDDNLELRLEGTKTKSKYIQYLKSQTKEGREIEKKNRIKNMYVQYVKFLRDVESGKIKFYGHGEYLTENDY